MIENELDVLATTLRVHHRDGQANIVLRALDHIRDLKAELDQHYSCDCKKDTQV